MSLPSTSAAAASCASSSSPLCDVWRFIDANWGFSERALFSVGLVVLTEVLTVFWFTFYELVLRNGWFRRYWIRRKTLPDRELIAKARKMQFTELALSIPLGYAIFPFLTWRGMSFHAPLPGAWGVLAQVIGCYLINETCFYWSHRALHTKALYKYHKKHHEFKESHGIAVLYAGAVENVLATDIPTIAGPMLLGCNFLVMWLHFVIQAYIGLELHSGFQFPWNPMNWVSWTKAETHDFHHSHNSGNYGGFWDSLMGTNKAFLEYQAKMAADGVPTVGVLATEAAWQQRLEENRRRRRELKAAGRRGGTKPTTSKATQKSQ